MLPSCDYVVEGFLDRMKQREFEDFTGRDIDGNRLDTPPECNKANVLCRGITSFIKGMFCNFDSYSVQDTQNTKIYTFTLPRIQ